MIAVPRSVISIQSPWRQMPGYMGSRVGDGVIVERGGCIGAGAWVEPGTVVPAGWIWAGRPARAFRELKPAERVEFARARDIYVGYSSDYRARRLP